MKQFGRILYYELKKIAKRKSTWITLGLLAAFNLSMELGYYFNSAYVDGEFLETHVEGSRIDRENGLRLSGRKIDQSFLDEMQEAYAGLEDMDSQSYLLTEEYQKNVRPYSNLYELILDFIRMSGAEIHPFTVTEEQLYRAKQEAVTKNMETYGLTDSEKSYWMSKEKETEEPLTYQYADGYGYLTSMSGVYRICLLVTFLIAICMSGVFTEEHGRRTDQLILCSKFGRAQVYFAKILAGSLFCLSAAGILLIITVISTYSMYGLDGFSAAIQLTAFQYPEPITAGQTFCIMAGILLLSSVLTGIFTMVLSEITHSSIAAMAAVIAVTFIMRLVPIPYTYRVLSQVWNYVPINLLKFDAGFWDLRLVSIFGLKFTSWQAAPILYLLFGAVLVIIGKIIYCRYQVQGR